MASNEDGLPFTVDIAEVMASLAELGIPDDVQEQCRQLLLHKKDTRPDRDAREMRSTAGGQDRAASCHSTPASFDMTAAQLAAGHPPTSLLMDSPMTLPPFSDLLPSPHRAAQHRKSTESAKSDDDNLVVVIPCVRSSVGRVIGKSGDTIKALQQYTNTSIQINQSTNPTQVTISGSVKSVRIAVAMISDIIDGRFKGFAMLRQITRGEAPMSSGAQHATVLSPGGMPPSSSRSSSSSRDINDVWTPNYVQGYGFLPPCASSGQAGSSQIEASHLNAGVAGGSDFSARFDHGRRRSDGDNRERGSAAEAWPDGSELHNPSWIPLSHTDPQVDVPPDVASQVLLSRLMQVTQDQHSAHRTHVLKQGTMPIHPEAAKTTHDVLQALIQLQQRHLHAQGGEQKEDDTGGRRSQGIFPPMPFHQDGKSGRKPGHDA